MLKGEGEELVDAPALRILAQIPSPSQERVKDHHEKNGGPELLQPSAEHADLDDVRWWKSKRKIHQVDWKKQNKLG